LLYLSNAAKGAANPQPLLLVLPGQAPDNIIINSRTSLFLYWNANCCKTAYISTERIEPIEDCHMLSPEYNMYNNWSKIGYLFKRMDCTTIGLAMINLRL
jgi:hypothetical protein